MKVCTTLFLASLSFLSFASVKVPELKIEEIQSGVFLHKSYSQVNGFGLVSSNGLVVVDSKKAFIVDTPWSDKDTAKLVLWIKQNNLELTGSISTHSHEDRTAGISWLNEHSIPTYASALTNSILKNENKPLATHSFKGDEALLANGLVEAFYPGGGHAKDNIVVWLPQSNILFGGCLVRSMASNGLGYTREAVIEQWAQSMDNVLSRYPDVQVVVPGHGKMGDIALLRHTKGLAGAALAKLKPKPVTSSGG